MMPFRRGHSLVELTVALFLASFLGLLVTGMLGSSARALAGLLDRSEAAETRRTVAALLHDELTVGVEGRDWRLEGERAVVLRAFRGWARICGPGAESGSWRVAWRGDRAPDPARDSLLVLGHQGRWVAVEFTQVSGAAAGAGAAPCQADPAERVADWRGPGWGPAGGWLPGADPHAPGGAGGEASGSSAGGGGAQVPLLARYFESGRYSLEDGAFRYRRGSGARQPLTPEVVDRDSGFRPAGDFLAGAAPDGASAVPPGVPGAGFPGIGVELILRRPDGTTSTDRWIVRGDGG